MTISRKHLVRTLTVVVLGVLASANAALAARQTYTAPKFPVPASARVQPSTTATGGVLPTNTATVPRTTATTPTVTAATPPPTVTTAPAPGARAAAAKPTAGSNGVSTPAILAAALAALLALGCAAWGVARLQAYEPHWTLSMRHTLAEAGFRASATWAEFADWARLGR